ncbi:MAG: flagellar M-ring protein FliF [Burkholderiales bacterium]|nr:flagellar M-ring protein FliF [Burkholderiales bacterium]
MDPVASPAVTTTATPVLVPAPRGALARLVALPAATKLRLGIGIAALAAVLVALALGTRDADYRVLFADLSEKDGGLVIERLQQMQVPHRFADGSGAILVPADRVYELRMKLTSAGLPKGGAAGYETLDQSSPFGVTARRESMALQRAREGELIRTIETLESVADARVHLAIPNANGFFRQQEKPSASVVLTLHPGRSLDRAQVAGIVHLVSRSVPELAAADVSVIDHSGALLNPSESAAGLDATQLEYRRQVESAHAQRVLALLEPVVGRDNLRATVSAEIDFSQVESTAEEYKPNQGGAPATVRALRSEETLEPGATAPAGVPGAASNQPPVAPSAPLQGQAAPLQAAGGAATAAAARREAETRYEVDRTVRVTRAASGSVRRLDAAVVVNHRSNVDARGKRSTAPLTAEEVDKLTALVRQAIGFDAARGDTVQVVNVPFHSEPVPEPEPLPLWQQPWLQDLLRTAAAPAALALVALLALFGLVRPALKAALPAPGSRLDTIVGDPQALPALAGETTPALGAPVQADPQQRIEAARSLARQNPAAVAGIMRGWVSGAAA